MWNGIKEGTLVHIVTWRCVSYLGNIVENNECEIVLSGVEVHELGNVSNHYMKDFAYIPKEDIEQLVLARLVPCKDKY